MNQEDLKVKEVARGGSVRTIPWTLGEPTFFFFITRGGGLVRLQ